MQNPRTLVAALALLSLLMLGGCASSREGRFESEAARVSVEIIVVAIDASTPSDNLDRLRALATRIDRTDTYVARTKPAEIERVIAQLQAGGRVHAIAHPDLTVRDGARASVSMTGGYRTTLAIGVRPVVMDDRVTIDTNIEFAGEEEENRFSRLIFEGPTLSFQRVRLAARPGAIDGQRLTRTTGTPIEPKALEVYVFATPRVRD